jgi:hypothetical protein
MKECIGPPLSKISIHEALKFILKLQETITLAGGADL